MPLIIPSGIFGNTIIAASNMLAACSAFRDVLAVENAAAALPSIHFPYADDQTDSLTNTVVAQRPRAILNPPSRLDLHQIGDGTWSDVGNLYLAFEFPPIPIAEGNRGDELTGFCNQLGAILAQLRALSGQDDPLNTGYTYLNLRRVSLIDGPAECEQQNENDELFYGATFLLDWIGG